MHKKSMEMSKRSPEGPECTHSDPQVKDTKGKDVDSAWPRRGSAADDSEETAIDLSSTSKQDGRKALKVSSPCREADSDSENEDWY